LRLIDAKKRELLSAGKSGTIEKDQLQGRDLLSVLIKSNLAHDLPDSQKMSTEEILARKWLFKALCTI